MLIINSNMLAVSFDAEGLVASTMIFINLRKFFHFSSVGGILLPIMKGSVQQRVIVAAAVCLILLSLSI